jgi:dephospho-CoA kinase
VLRVGLTGGIACGKSHVLRRLADRGCHTLDLDAVARDVTAPGSGALAEIEAAFGPGVVGEDGALDRPALAALVFGDEAARARLNAIVHPRVRAAEAAWARSVANRPGTVGVTDAALLVEAGAHLRFDRLVVVHCAPALQLSRLRARDGLDERSARARIEAQMDVAEKRAFAHYEVDTSGSVEDTDRLADALAEELRSLAGRPRGSAGVAVERLLGGLVHGPREGPRGLSPFVLLAEAASAGGLEMERLARRLVPPARGPWYRAAEEATPGASAARLGVALTAWALRRAAPDREFLAAAAGSVARLTHTDPRARADACLVALVAQQRIVSPSGGADAAAEAARLAHLAARFGGGPPSGGLGAVWNAIARAPTDPSRAAAEGVRLGADGELAAAIAGLGCSVGLSAEADTLRATLAAIPLGG